MWVIWYGFFFFFFTDPWSVEDLLCEDDIIDKIPLDKLQRLGMCFTGISLANAAAVSYIKSWF